MLFVYLLIMCTWDTDENRYDLTARGFPLHRKYTKDKHTNDFLSASRPQVRIIVCLQSVRTECS